MWNNLKSEVKNFRLRNGEKIILEIDVQERLQVKEKFYEAQWYFSETSTKKELEKKIERVRNTDSEETIALRLKKIH